MAKFGSQLAQRLGVPFCGLGDFRLWGGIPLFSLKWSELESSHVTPFAMPRPYGVFWHDAGEPDITGDAVHVFYADPSLGSPGLWCPSLITQRQRPVRLFSFGMAHKLQIEHYRKVQKLLAAASIPYHLRVSVGLHEGTSLDTAEKHFDALGDIMGDQHVTILGILSDDAVSEELANCDYVLAFFEKGLRANNTTVHAALSQRRPVLTNHDEQTPEFLRIVTMSIDRDEWVRWLQGTIHPYSWDALLEAMRKECEKSRSVTA